MWRLLLVLLASSLAAQELLDDALIDDLGHYDRVDVIGAVSPRFPSDEFNPIQEIAAYYFQRISPTLNLYYNLAAYEQQEGRGFLGSLGCFHDWTDNFFTVTTVAAGTRTDILPRIDASNEFAYKFLSDKSLVIPLGIRYVSYWTNQRSLVLSTGFQYYLQRWIFAYRFYFYHNTPGSLNASAHKGTVIYGEEGWQFTALDLLFGKNAYLAFYGVDPQTINQTTYGVLLNHRHWFSPCFGFILEGGYTYVKDTYRLWRFAFGTFLQF